jgi:hypothetical protein
MTSSVANWVGTPTSNASTCSWPARVVWPVLLGYRWNRPVRPSSTSTSVPAALNPGMHRQRLSDHQPSDATFGEQQRSWRLCEVGLRS